MMTKDLARLEYLSGNPRKDICKRYNVKYDTLDKWILRGKWTREKWQVVRKTTKPKDRLRILKSLWIVYQIGRQAINLDYDMK